MLDLLLVIRMAVLTSRFLQRIIRIAKSASTEERVGLVVRIEALIRSLGYGDAEAAHKLNIPERLIGQLRRGDWRSIKRSQLNTLQRLANGHGIKDFIEWEPHPLWATLGNAKLCIFHAPNSSEDAEFAAELQKVAKQLGAPEVRTLDHWTTTPVMAELHDTSNCIYVGGSKRNWKSDYGYRRMCGADELAPADARRRLPVFFAFWRADWLEDEERASAEIVEERRDCGIVLADTPPRRLGVTRHETLEEFKRAEGIGRDAGVLFARRTENKDTGKAVTSIVLGGYSALATRELGYALMNDTVPLSVSDLASGQLVFRLLRFAFRTEANTQARSSVKVHRAWFGREVTVDQWNNDDLPLLTLAPLESESRRRRPRKKS